MKIFPAIDILEGKVVRLTKGDFDKLECYAFSPYDVARGFFSSGAKCLHIVDLDGAKTGETKNFYMISKIATLGFDEIQVGGGIRTLERVEQYLDAGVTRVILGTVAITNFDFVKECVEKYKDKIAVGIDVKGECVATHGWQEVSKIKAFDLVKKCEKAGVDTIIYTDIDTDGMMEGTNLEAFKKLKESFNINIIASGGITNLDEIRNLKSLSLYGAIVGKALYLGAISLEELFSI